MRVFVSALLLIGLAGCASFWQKTQKNDIPDALVWNIDNLDYIGGWETSIVGAPRVIDTPKGRAVEFDGLDDALVVENHPLAGTESFTAEIIFLPYKYGWNGQRFFHLETDETGERIIFTCNLTEDDQGWFLNTYIRSGGKHYSLQDEGLKHPLEEWYQAALVVDGNEMRQYVNGVLEKEGEIAFIPPAAGYTSIGARFTQANWFSGAIRVMRFTPRALSPEEFLRP